MIIYILSIIIFIINQIFNKSKKKKKKIKILSKKINEIQINIK